MDKSIYKTDLPVISPGEYQDANVSSSRTCCSTSTSSDDDDKDLGCSKMTEMDVKSTRGGDSRQNSTVHSRKPSHRGKNPQDMTTPLKKWLLENRGNPYPTKKEKVALAGDSAMTLIQVTNWFANARRRLKNTAHEVGLACKRSKLHNRHESGNADRLSEELDDSKDGTEHKGLPNLDTSTESVIPGWGNNRSWSIAPSTVANGEEIHLRGMPSPSSMYFPETANSQKFKQAILHRYLNDSIEHQRNGYQPYYRLTNDRTPPSVRCFESGFTSAHEYELEDASSCSPNSIGSDGNQSVFQDVDCRQSHDMLGQERSSNQHADVSHKTTDAEEIYWKEIIAAVVLTNMARAKLQQPPL